MEITEQFVRVFDAEDKDGTLYTIREYQQYGSITPVGQPTQYVKGRKRFFLVDGTPVQDRGDGTFVIVERGAIVREV
jgi:hypothetical protein